MHRRAFLSAAAAASLATTIARRRAAAKDTANDRISIAVIGVRGRGRGLLNNFTALEKVDLKYVVDLDPVVLAQQTEAMASRTGRKPEAVADFRRVLDDQQLDAIVLGTPDHWHALPTIMACQAGKDVYVEKPDGHNLLEGPSMIAAAKKYGRVVQLGTQARSKPSLLKAIEYIRAGHLGRVLYAKAWESSLQKSLGHPADCDPPKGVDYDFWLGPAPKHAFNPLRWHGNWRWFFDYGTGDLGNDGVHRLDMARWGMETALAAQHEKPLGLPERVSALGGKYYFDDDQQWPDTLAVSYDFGGRVLTYEMHVWSRYTLDGETEGAAVYGDNGYLIFGNKSWRAYELRNKLVREEQFDDDESAGVPHAQNFIDCMRSREKPNADLETVGHPSSLLCHIGNAAWRAGRTLQFDPATYTFTGDDEANQYRTRAEYRKPWVLPKPAEV
ncbi:MAG TPA: Gfo/Idh/MocA family oxidoreductase [Pirellulales bacterium]|nr:Gfo/Idh/MocA family oxidoreductase [Pirellulales bacterium]